MTLYEMYDDYMTKIKASTYEAADNGYISEYEKNLIIDEINVALESCSGFYENLKTVEDKINEKYESGVYTENHRDALTFLVNNLELPGLTHRHFFESEEEFMKYYGLTYDVFENESDIITVGTTKERLRDLMSVVHKWKESNKNIHKHTVRVTKIPDAEAKEIREIYKKMLDKDIKYSTYKNLYKEFVDKCKLRGNAPSILSFKVKKEGKNNNTVEVTYANPDVRRVVIPNGACLTHVSPNRNIQALQPHFRSKNGYLFKTPRVYFTIRKQNFISNTLADLKTNTPVTAYRPKENIRTAYIDPFLKSYWQGAIYVETEYPIKVVKARGNALKENTLPYMEESDMGIDAEEPTFDNIYDFMEYYGIQFADEEETIQESYQTFKTELLSKIGSGVRYRQDEKDLKEKWKESMQSLSKKQKAEKVFKSKEELKAYYGIWKKMSKTQDYASYKDSYKAICHAVKISDSSLIDSIKFYKDFKTKEPKMVVFYYKGKKKIVIPANCELIHISPKQSLSVLKPSFRGKTLGTMMYPTKRVYFTMRKPMNKKSAGIQGISAAYTPKVTISTAYIDPSCTKYSVGSVYIETDTGIPVRKI